MAWASAKRTFVSTWMVPMGIPHTGRWNLAVSLFACGQHPVRVSDATAILDFSVLAQRWVGR